MNPKTYYWLFGFLLLGLPGFSQPRACSEERYKLLMQEADTFVKQEAYSQAIRKYNSARACQPQYAAEVDERIAIVFEKVNQERIKADNLREQIGKEQKITERALEKAEKLVAFFKFGKEKAAWAFDNSTGGFSVIDNNANRLSEAIYKNPSNFRNGIAVAQVNNQQVIVRDDGTEISGRADFMQEATGGYYICYNQNQNIHLLNQLNGDTLADALKYGTTSLIRFNRKGKTGLMDEEGKIVLTAVYDAIGEFSSGRAEVTLGGKRGWIDASGRELLSPKYNSIRLFSKNLMIISVGGEKHSSYTDYPKWGLIDSSGRAVVPPVYDDIRVSLNGFIVKVGSKWGLIDTSGRELIFPVYDDIRVLSDGFGVKLADKWGLVDLSGRVLISPSYDDLRYFTNGLAVINIGAKKKSLLYGRGEMGPYTQKR